MPNAEQLGMTKLENTIWPITVRYNLGLPWGVSSQELTFEVPDLVEQTAPTLLFCSRLWRDFIATAISRRVTLDFMEVVMWKRSPLPMLGATGAPPGGSGFDPSPRDKSGVIRLHSFGDDKYSRRPFYLPGMPVRWQDDGLLNGIGMTSLYALAAELHMGTTKNYDNGPIQWMIAYPDIEEPDVSNLRGVAFRSVEYLRICEWCGRAPDTVPLDWP